MLQQKALFGHTGLLQMSYVAMCLELSMGKRNKGTEVFTFSFLSSVSHWSKFAP